jgi:hypothetical protein
MGMGVMGCTKFKEEVWFAEELTVIWNDVSEVVEIEGDVEGDNILLMFNYQGLACKGLLLGSCRCSTVADSVVHAMVIKQNSASGGTPPSTSAAGFPFLHPLALVEV